MISELIEAWADAFSRMLVLVFDMLGFRRALIGAIATIAILLTLGFGVSLFARWKEKEAKRNVPQTLTLLERHAESLAANISEQVNVELPGAIRLTATDAWGNRLCIDYSDTMLDESVRVWSLGEDGRAGTRDDLSVSRRVPRSKSESAKRAFEKATQVITNRKQSGERRRQPSRRG